MMIVTPVYLVTIPGASPDSDTEIWRVPETNLRQFIDVLFFNQKVPFNVRLEPATDFSRLKPFTENEDEERGPSTSSPMRPFPGDGGD
jgi:hypothetical protein